MTRRRLWLGRAGALAVVGGLLGLLVWGIDRPEIPWVVACLAGSVLLIVANGLVVEWRHGRWNDRVVAAWRAGPPDARPPPPPRDSLVVLGIALALAAAAGVILVLSCIRWHAEPGAVPGRGDTRGVQG